MEGTNLIKMTRAPFLRPCLFLMFVFCACDITAHPTETDFAIYSVDESSKYEVTANKVNVRSAPTTSSKVVGSLSHGDIVNVKSIQKGWARVSFHGKDCYVKADFLKAVGKKEEKGNSVSKQQSTQRETQTRSRQESGGSRSVSSSQAQSTKRNGIVQNNFKSWNPFVEVQPIIVCAKGAKPRFDFLGGVTKGLNNYLSVGAGTGLSTDFNNPLVVPLFARLTIQNKKLDLTPLCLFDAGYDFNVKHIKGSAIRLNPTFGIKTGGFYIGAGYMATIPTMKEAEMVHNVNFKLGYEFDANSKNSKFSQSMKKFFKHSLPNFLKRTYVEVEGGAGYGLETEQIDEDESERVGNNFHLQLAWNYRANENWDIGIGAGFRKYKFDNKLEDEDVKLHSIPLFLRNQYYFVPEKKVLRPYVGLDFGLNMSTLKNVIYNEGQIRANDKLVGYEDIVYKQHSTNLLFRPRVGVVYNNRINASLSYTKTSVTVTQEDSDEGRKSTHSIPSLDLTLGVRLW